MGSLAVGVHSDESVANNTRAFSILIAFSGAVWRRYFAVQSVTRRLTVLSFFQSYVRFLGSVRLFVSLFHFFTTRLTSASSD